MSCERFAKGDGVRKRIFHDAYGVQDIRIAQEKDFDRVIFSTPVRRLQDKTQVFPLDQHDSVRTRLTHSLEVSNLARTLASQLVLSLRDNKVDLPENAERSMPALAAAIAMSHDIGNPPFGHQGEEAIRMWVGKISSTFADCVTSAQDQAYLNDYRYFDGNPQGFRLLTQLQGVDAGGLNLSASTLRASVKYPWGSSSKSVNVKKPKFGYFSTESKVFEWAGEHCGLLEGVRHPLTSIMEACDDIAYSVLDVEDGIKKDLISTAQLVFALKQELANGEAKKWIEVLSSQYEEDVRWTRSNGIVGREGEDVLTQLLRSYIISLLVSDVVPLLTKSILDGTSGEKNPCVSGGRVNALLDGLKGFSKLYVYSHPAVERIELQGHRIIPYLLGAFWNALAREEQGKASKLDLFVKKRISANYLRVYERTKASFPGWYARLQLVCDMVCGMTDSFAVQLEKDFLALGVEL